MGAARSKSKVGPIRGEHCTESSTCSIENASPRHHVHAYFDDLETFFIVKCRRAFRYPRAFAKVRLDIVPSTGTSSPSANRRREFVHRKEPLRLRLDSDGVLAECTSQEVVYLPDVDRLSAGLKAAATFKKHVARDLPQCTEFRALELPSSSRLEPLELRLPDDKFSEALKIAVAICLASGSIWGNVYATAATAGKRAGLAYEGRIGNIIRREILKLADNIRTHAANTLGHHGFNFEQQQASSFNIDAAVKEELLMAAAVSKPESEAITGQKGNFGIDLKVEDVSRGKAEIVKAVQAKAGVNIAQMKARHNAKYGVDNAFDRVPTDEIVHTASPESAKVHVRGKFLEFEGVSAKTVTHEELRKVNPGMREEELRSLVVKDEHGAMIKRQKKLVAFAAKARSMVESRRKPAGHAVIAAAFAVAGAAIQSSGQYVCRHRRGACSARAAVLRAIGDSAVAGVVGYGVARVSIAAPVYGMIASGAGFVLGWILSKESWAHKSALVGLKAAFPVASAGLCFLPFGWIGALFLTCADGFCDVAGRAARLVDCTVRAKELCRLRDLGRNYATSMYSALELPPGCTGDELKSRYQELALHCDPESEWGNQQDFEALTLAFDFLVEYRGIDAKIELEYHGDNWLTVVLEKWGRKGWRQK